MMVTLSGIVTAMMVAQTTDAAGDSGKCEVVVDNGKSCNCFMFNESHGDENRNLQIVFFACGHEIRVIVNPWRSPTAPLSAVHELDRGIMHESFLGVYIDGELVQNIAQANENWAGENNLIASLFKRERPDDGGQLYITNEAHVVTNGNEIMPEGEYHAREVGRKARIIKERRENNPNKDDIREAELAKEN